MKRPLENSMGSTGRWRPTKRIAQYCSVHGKKRTIKNMTQNEQGRWVCLPGEECRIGGAAKTSAVGARVRMPESIPEIEDNPWGLNLNQSEKKSKRSSVVSSHPILSSRQYKAGNFKGALQEHFQRKGVLKFYNVEEQIRDGSRTGQFIAKCRIDNNRDTEGKEGLAYGNSKKEATQFAALDLIMKLKLLTPKEHFEQYLESPVQNV